ncbi:hypothetical protein O181_017545 [Austropuccinia psidii MF-1]|uniref:Peroxin-3 n=1 Tax=Austropuccinia psidii MF-1 TaxID=1389203 RepID=A0A9Q3C6Z0_9BASI|nr:hypothetical protein [Austropuccinia psidii MF-1]
MAFDGLGRLLNWGRRPMTILVTACGGGYLAMSYIQTRLNEMQESLTRNRVCTENLRRRFEQNQENCCFTILALIPTLSKQILEGMNVEKLVEFLNQTKSQARHPATTNPITQSQSPQLNGDDTESENTRNQKNSSLLDGSSLSPITDIAEKNDKNNATPPLQTSQPDRNQGQEIDFLVRPDGTRIQKRSEIWQEMMCLSFSRLLASLYGIALLTLQTHIQLGLLGRNSYLRSIISPESLTLDDDEIRDQQCILPKCNVLDPTTERRYLTLSWWYLHQGWKKLKDRIRAAVVEALASKNLKDQVSLSDLQMIFESVCKKVELEPDGSDFKFSSILLPSSPCDEVEALRCGGMLPEDCVVNPQLRTLLDETQDFLDCPDFRFVLSSAMNRAIGLCTTNLCRNSSLTGQDPKMYCNAEAIGSRFTELQSNNDSQPWENRVRIVDLVPIISKECHVILNAVPNEYTEAINETRELKEFCSVIYTSFDGLT